KSACGGVIRNVLVRGLARNLGSCSTLMAELWDILSMLGIKAFIVVYQKKGFHRISLESDSAIAVSIIDKSCSAPHPCASIVSLINCFRMEEWQVHVSHIYRQTNQVAD
ncbi:putative ribonuclease H protein, partial [Trifolium medium]|nr:putative ribonuclease H protein [Trifolium medium]